MAKNIFRGTGAKKVKKAVVNVYEKRADKAMSGVKRVEDLDVDLYKFNTPKNRKVMKIGSAIQSRDRARKRLK